MTAVAKKNLDEFMFALMRSQVGITEEGGNNLGPMVEVYQRAVLRGGQRTGQGTATAEKWCAAFTQWIIWTTEKAFETKSLVYASELAVKTFKESPASIRLSKPEPFVLMVWENRANPGKGHIEFVVAINPDGTLQTIGGNTGPDAIDDVIDEGEGVFWKRKVQNGDTRKKVLLGYIRVWQDQNESTGQDGEVVGLVLT